MINSFISVIAFIYWFFFGIKAIFTYIYFSSDAQSATIISLGVNIALFIVVLIALLHKHVVTIDKRMSPVLLGILVYIVFSLFTVFVLSPEKITAFGYWLYMSVEAITVMLMYCLSRDMSIVKSSIYGILLSGVLVGAVILYASMSGVNVRYGDSTLLSPNVIGNYLAIVILIMMYVYQRRMVFSLNMVQLGSVIILLLVSLAVVKSKTAIVAVMFAMLFFYVYTTRGLGKIVSVAIIGVMTLTLYFILEDYIYIYINEVQGGQALETLSGRSYLWADTLQMIEKFPYIGHGFMSFREIGPQNSEIIITQAHNEVLQQLFTFGIAGLFITIFIYASYFKFVYSFSGFISRRSEVGLAYSLLIYMLIRGLVEANMTGLLFEFQYIVLVLVILLYKPDHDGKLMFSRVQSTEHGVCE